MVLCLCACEGAQGVLDGGDGQDGVKIQFCLATLSHNVQGFTHTHAKGVQARGGEVTALGTTAHGGGQQAREMDQQGGIQQEMQLLMLLHHMGRLREFCESK